MSDIEILPPGKLASHDEAALREAVDRLEAQTLASRLGGAIGMQVGALRSLIPARARKMVGAATEVALKAALKASLKTFTDKVSRQPSRDLLHKVAAAASGAVGGAFGISGLPVELPVSTTILLRSIAEIARSEGEDLADPATALACLEVFALGGSEDAETGFESSYLAVRAVLAREVTASVRFLLHAGLAGETAPVLAKFLSTVSARFGVAVGEKLAAQGAPVVGALGGAAINLVFASHFQALARGHFTVRRLERTYGADVVRDEYRRLLQSRGSAKSRAPFAAADAVQAA